MNNDRIEGDFVILDGMAFSKQEILNHRENLCNALEMLDSQKWQPIETAPKDSARILILVCGEQCIGYRPEDCPDDGAVCDFTRCYPTHWMPLPPPPSKS